VSGRPGLFVIAFLLFGVGLFYAFNAFIQIRERGFSEPADIPIAIVSVVIGALALVSARRG
jgi:hypothetical protein